MQGKLVMRVQLEERTTSLSPPQECRHHGRQALYLMAECRGRDPSVALASRVRLDASLSTRRLTTSIWCLLHAMWRGGSAERGPQQ